MEFKVNKSDFFPEIMLGQGIVERKSTLPILSNILIEAKENQITITSTDLEVALKSNCTAQVVNEGAITVPSRKLYDIINALPDTDNISVKLEENNRLELNCGKSSFKLVGLSKDDFPVVVDFSAEEGIAIDSVALSNAIDLLVFAISRESSRYAVNGAFMILEGTSFIMVATDGYRLAFLKVNDCVSGVEGREELIIPQKTLKEIKKMIEKSDDDKVFFGKKENQTFYRIGGRTLTSRILEDSFPNYQKVLPEGNDKFIRFNRSTLTGALKRVSLLSDESSKSVTLAFLDNKLEITSSNPDMGEAKEEISIDYSGDEMRIGFNAQYLLDFLQVVKTDDVMFVLKNETEQGMMIPVEKDDSKQDYKYVVMPMRL